VAGAFPALTDQRAPAGPYFTARCSTGGGRWASRWGAIYGSSSSEPGARVHAAKRQHRRRRGRRRRGGPDRRQRSDAIALSGRLGPGPPPPSAASKISVAFGSERYFATQKAGQRCGAKLVRPVRVGAAVERCLRRFGGGPWGHPSPLR
jgi:hypothetical protein